MCSTVAHVPAYYMCNANSKTWWESHLIPLLLPCDSYRETSSLGICGTKCRMDMYTHGGWAQPESPGLRARCNFHCSCFAQVSTVFQILCYSVADQEWKTWLDVSKQMLHCTVLCRKNGFDTWATHYKLVFFWYFHEHKKICYTLVSRSFTSDFGVQIYEQHVSDTKSNVY